MTQGLRTGLCAGAAALLCACATPPSMQPDLLAGECYRPKGQRPLCLDAAPPSPQAAAQARGLAADPSALTLYLVRAHPGDPIEPVQVRQAGYPAPVRLLPHTFARLRLPAGSHTLTLAWNGGTRDIAVDGPSGAVRIYALQGSAFLRSRAFTLEPIEREAGLRLLRHASFVADVQR